MTGPHAQLSFIDTFYNVKVKKLPTKYPFLVVVALRGDEGDRFTITIEGPDGKNRLRLHEGVVGEAPRDPDAPRDKVVTLGLFRQFVVDFEFDAEGIYSVVLRQGKRVINRADLGVLVKRDSGRGQSGATAKRTK
jgi:hypothetical protein